MFFYVAKETIVLPQNQFDARRPQGQYIVLNTSSMGKYSKCNYLRGHFLLLPIPVFTNYVLLVPHTSWHL